MRCHRTAAALAAVYLIWGSTYLAIKHMVIGFPPLVGIGIRFLVAGAIIYAVAARRAPRIRLRQWRAGLELGTLLVAGGTGLVAVAEAGGIGSGLAASAAASIPLWTGLIGGAMGSWPSRREWLGLAIGIAGVGLLSLERDFSANPAAAIVMFAAPVSWALGSVRRSRLDLPPGLAGVAAEMLAGGAVALVVGLARGEHIESAPPLAAWLGLGYLVVFGSIIAFTAYMHLLETVRPALATSYAYVNPVVAIGLGLGLGAESVTGQAIVALPLILTGVAIISGLGAGGGARRRSGRVTRAHAPDARGIPVPPTTPRCLVTTESATGSEGRIEDLFDKGAQLVLPAQTRPDLVDYDKTAFNPRAGRHQHDTGARDSDTSAVDQARRVPSGTSGGWRGSVMGVVRPV